MRLARWDESVQEWGLGFSLFRLLWAAAALVVFAAFYASLSVRSPSAFSEPLTTLDAVYLALTTFTTPGFGDIRPLRRTTLSG